MEIWKNITGYEGLYQVSNLGRVKSTQYHNGTYERILKPSKGKNGYLSVALYKDKKCKWHLVHRLVAQAFLDNPDNLSQINHKDECKTNNIVDNLEWCSASYNLNYNDGRKRRAEKQINGKRSKTVYQYSLNGEFVKEWKSLMEIKRSMGFSVGNIGQCCLGKRKTSYGYRWCYK